MVNRQTDRQKQTDHNNPLLLSSVNYLKYVLFSKLKSKRFDLCDSAFIQFVYFSHGFITYNTYT